MLERVIDLGRITSERHILEKCLAKKMDLRTDVSEVHDRPFISNSVSQVSVGVFRSRDSRKAVIADIELFRRFEKKGLAIPSFLEAGPRAELRYQPCKVRAAIVTTGGVAPGLHCVIHSIVKRHCHTYPIEQAGGKVFGVYNSFKGLCELADNLVELSPAMTEEWLDEGGSQLGIVRYYHGGKKDEAALDAMADVITTNLRNNNIDILYVIGGDGSLKAAHKIAIRNPTRSIVGIPKTMDNDILWVWQSFGFDTAVEQATKIINTLHSEAQATRRVCLVELFGAESGFVAANAALASGHVDAVLIPEVFSPLKAEAAEKYLNDIVLHIQETVQGKVHNPHANMVLAEGVGTVLEKIGATIGGTKVSKRSFVGQLTALIEQRIVDARGHHIPVFVNEPRHYIRAVPANAHDQIYCERLGALAVDNALAGYTDFMISQWLTEYVLVPICLVEAGQKSVPISGMFWKQVVSSTGQPLSDAECTVDKHRLARPLHNLGSNRQNTVRPRRKKGD